MGLRGGSDHEGWDVDELLADGNVLLSDQDSGVVDGSVLSSDGLLGDNSLKSSFKELVHGKTQNVIEFLL